MKRFSCIFPDHWINLLTSSDGGIASKEKSIGTKPVSNHYRRTIIEFESSLQQCILIALYYASIQKYSTWVLFEPERIYYSEIKCPIFE